MKFLVCCCSISVKTRVIPLNLRVCLIYRKPCGSTNTIKTSPGRMISSRIRSRAARQWRTGHIQAAAASAKRLTLGNELLDVPLLLRSEFFTRRWFQRRLASFSSSPLSRCLFVCLLILTFHRVAAEFCSTCALSLEPPHPLSVCL